MTLHRAGVQDITVPGCSSLGCALDLPVAACCPASPFLLCFEALSASCRALRSAFNSALLLAGLSDGVGDSETGTSAGTAGGAGGDSRLVHSQAECLLDTNHKPLTHCNVQGDFAVSLFHLGTFATALIEDLGAQAATDKADYHLFTTAVPALTQLGECDYNILRMHLSEQRVGWELGELGQLS